MTDFLNDAIDRLRDGPRCNGTVDDFIDELDEGRVTAFKLDGVPALNVCAVYDPREKD